MGFKAGDIIAFSGHGILSRLIRCATCGPYSHIAVVGRHPCSDRRLVVYESTSQSPRPCLISGEIVSGVQCHELDEVLGDHGGGWHFPLTAPLDDFEGEVISGWCVDRLGSPYDFSDAIAARSAGLGWLRNAVARWCGCASDDAEWICSDLVASALHRGNRYPERRGHVSPSGLIRELRWNDTIQSRKWVT
jgi:hypothetical protein